MKLVYSAAPVTVPAPLDAAGAWALLQSRIIPSDPIFGPASTRDGLEAYYAAKHKVALAVQPTSVLEIGVRAGYSALTILAACPEASYVGLDIGDGGGWGGDLVCWSAAPQVLAGYRVELYEGDSQAWTTMDGEEYDLAHVDGDHSLEGAYHDITLAASCAQYILVDDYDLIATVRASVDHFLVRHAATWAAQYIGDAHFRGQMLLKRRV